MVRGGLLLLTSLVLLIPAARVQAEDFPYDTSSGTELVILGTAAAAWGYGLWLNNQEDRARPFIPEEVAALDRDGIPTFDLPATRNWSPGAAELSDHLQHTAWVAPLILDLSGEGQRQPLTLTAMHLETMLLNSGATFMLKNLFRRPRPFVHNPDPRIPESLRLSTTARRSFPSGHTSSTFASLVFLATVYGKLYPESESRHWVWAGCLATAGTTGYLRYRAGYHYPTDIIAGAALGAFTGWLVPQLHEVDRDTAGGAGKSGGLVMGLTIGF